MVECANGSQNAYLYVLCVPTPSKRRLRDALFFEYPFECTNTKTKIISDKDVVRFVKMYANNKIITLFLSTARTRIAPVSDTFKPVVWRLYSTIAYDYDIFRQNIISYENNTRNRKHLFPRSPGNYSNGRPRNAQSTGKITRRYTSNDSAL